MAKSKNRPAETADDRQIVITRVFDAPRELVWEAWTDPRHVAQWWGPNGFTTTIEKMDVRPGGGWTQVMHGPDGTDYPGKSVFTEVVRPERIVYSHGGGKKGGTGVRFNATWTFETVDAGKTRLTIRMVFPSAADRDTVVREYGAIEGGRQTLERLAEHLPKMGQTSRHVVVTRFFDAPPAVVFDAWLDPAAAGRWLFATPGGKMVRVEIDARVGGKFVIAEKRGDLVTEHFGTYLEIERPRRLAFGFSVPQYSSEVTRVTVEIAGSGPGCELTLTHEGVLPEYHERSQAGWAGILAQLAATVAAAPGFVLTRAFDAPRDLVWKAWTEREHLMRWFGPKGVTIPVCSLDLRPGGVFHYCMKAADGHELWGKMTYREIVPPEKLVVIVSFSDAKGGVTRHPMSATWPLETLSTTTFTEHEGKTTLTLHWAAHNATEAERQTFDSNHAAMAQGWGGTMDQLAAYLATST